MLIASKSSDSSVHVGREIALAFDEKKKIIPLRLEDYELSKTNFYFLANILWIDAFKNMDSALKKLLQAIQLEI